MVRRYAHLSAERPKQQGLRDNQEYARYQGKDDDANKAKSG